MTVETEKTYAIAQEFGVSMRMAAYIHALNRLGEAMDAKGTRDYFRSSE